MPDPTDPARLVPCPAEEAATVYARGYESAGVSLAGIARLLASKGHERRAKRKKRGEGEGEGYDLMTDAIAAPIVAARAPIAPTNVITDLTDSVSTRPDSAEAIRVKRPFLPFP